MINKQLLHDYILDPKNPVKCYRLGYAYYSVEHYGEAVSFFLRAAENSEGDLRYNSMLYVAFCYRALGGRNYTLNSIYKTMIARFPKQPEAYFHLAKLCELENANVDGYMWAHLALENADNAGTEYHDLGFDFAEVLFLKAYFAWKLDKFAESRRTYQHILKNYLHELDEGRTQFLRNQLLNFGMAHESKTIQTYDKNNKHQWIYHFDGIETIEKNYSQALQDMFVLYCHNGKKNGTYLEVGAAFPYYTSNSALLEQFGWRGVGLELDPDMVKNYNENRKSKSLLQNALEADYDNLLKEYCGVTDVDYLQVDIKTSEETYKALQRIPFDKYRFAVITYEHDDYVDTTQSYKQKSRDFLFSKGYVLAVPDVAPIDGYSFEDWWIHPDLIDITRVWSMNRLAKIDWGNTTLEQRDQIYNNVQLENLYEYWRPVKDGDVVVDIGANVGAFGVRSLRKQLKALYEVEASSKLMDTCIQNTLNHNSRNSPVKYLNQAISKPDSKINSFTDQEEFTVVTFKQFLKNNNISYIDFLKINAEGAEYDIFSSENIYFLKNNTVFIAAEFHLDYEDGKEKWKTFRDKYLPYFPNRRIKSCKNQHIAPGYIIDLEPYLNDDNFVNNYEHPFMVYINNDPTYV
jgi:FkbM family methyltransferase